MIRLAGRLLASAWLCLLPAAALAQAGPGDRLAEEAASLRADGPALAKALVEAAARARAAEERVASIDERLRDYAEREAVLQRSLAERRAVLGEVLAALQRLRLTRPPAPLVDPLRLVEELRAEGQLGLVVPELGEEAARVLADLRAVEALRGRARAEGAALAAETASLAVERTRILALVESRRQRLASVESELAAEKARAEAAASRVRDAEELAGALRDSEAAGRDAQQRAAEERMRERVAALSGVSPAELRPRTPFGQMRGRLLRPVSGPLVRGFGAADGRGGVSRGITIAARPHAIVTAVADGRVAFAGPFRSFGLLLIIDAGGGYYLLSAGMAQVSVAAGQFVLAGEPVGQMAGGELASASSGSVPSGPVDAGRNALYVEFRKDGGPIDPGPWWSGTQGEKVRG